MASNTPGSHVTPPNSPPPTSAAPQPDDVGQTGGPDGSEPVWGVVVVHGVGITRPGDTVYNFLSTIQTMDKARHGPGSNVLEVTAPPEVALLKCVDPDPPDPTLRPPVTNPDTEDRFPVHTRQVTVTDPATGQKQKAVFAEVFWADVSGANRGFWDWGGASQIVLRLLTLLFQFRYLADMATTHHGLRSAYCHRLFIYLVSLLLCFPIAGPNVFLFYLVTAHWLIETGQKGVELLRPHVSDGLLSPVAFLGLGLAAVVAGATLWG